MDLFPNKKQPKAFHTLSVQGHSSIVGVFLGLIGSPYNIRIQGLVCRLLHVSVRRQFGFF